MALWIKIVLSVLGIQVLGGVSAMITADQIPGWYAGLQRPPGTPPNAIFGPVWITLYAMMGVAFALVWHRAEPGAAKRKALGVFGFQLFLNMAWTPIFFGWHQMLVALMVIVVLWFAIAWTIRLFWGVLPLAGALLLPYLLWVSYATYLNAGYWGLNR